MCDDQKVEEEVSEDLKEDKLLGKLKKLNKMDQAGKRNKSEQRS